MSDGFEAHVIMFLYVDNDGTFHMKLTSTQVPETWLFENSLLFPLFRGPAQMYYSKKVYYSSKLFKCSTTDSVSIHYSIELSISDTPSNFRIFYLF